MLVDEHLERRSLERRPSTQNLVEEHTEAVPIGLGPDDLGRGLLRRHVRGGADDAPIGRLLGGQASSQAKVEEHQSTRVGDEDVAGLDVAMDEASAMEGNQRVDELGKDRPHSTFVDPRRVSAPQVGDDVDSAHELHGEKPLAPILAELAELDEVGMAEVHQGAKLILEAIERLRTDVANSLEGDLRALLTIERLVDHAHAALADAAHDLEAFGAGKHRGQTGSRRSPSHA